MTDLLFRGGTILTPEGPVDDDLRVTNGLVEGIGPGVATEVVDVTGLWILPGGVDAHVHSRDPGFPDKEDFGSLTEAAAAGGITTVVDMPNTIPAVDSGSVFAAKAETAASRALVDFGLWGVVRSTSTPDQLQGLAAAGAIGFKAFLGYAFHRGRSQVIQTFQLDDPELEAPPDYGTIVRLAPVIAALGLPLAVHCEDLSVLAEFARPLGNYADALASRPAAAEAVAIAALAAVAESTGLRLQVVHLSSAAGLRVAEAFPAVVLETCPQYLWFTEADYDLHGPVMKMYPLVRGAGDREALRRALHSGRISRVGTDHAPHTDAEKLGVSLQDAAAGAPGIQTLYLSCLELARQLGDGAMAARWVSENPARELGIYPRKGALQAGSDADLVLVDPAGETLIRAADMRSKQTHGLFEGARFSFALHGTYLRGRPVGEQPGRLVKPTPQNQGHLPGSGPIQGLQ